MAAGPRRGSRAAAIGPDRAGGGGQSARYRTGARSAMRTGGTELAAAARASANQTSRRRRSELASMAHQSGSRAADTAASMNASSTRSRISRNMASRAAFIARQLQSWRHRTEGQDPTGSSGADQGGGPNCGDYSRRGRQRPAVPSCRPGRGPRTGAAPSIGERRRGRGPTGRQGGNQGAALELGRASR